MSVSLNPSNTLGFRRPLTQLVKRSLTITNHQSQPIAFKVKTTAPKLYCVRPNSGRVEPGESLEVAVMLQALKEEPALNSKCKDKFLIQSTIITPDKETMSLQDIWASTDANEEGKVYQQKLRVTYLPAEGQTLEEEDETVHANQSILNQSDSQNYDTVRQHPTTDNHPGVPSEFQAPPGLEEPRRPSTPPADFSVAREESHEAQQPSQAPQDILIPIVNEPSHRAPTPPPAPETLPIEDAAPQVPPVEESIPTAIPEPIPEPAPVRVVVTKENPLNQQLLVENKMLKAEIERLNNELALKFTQPPVSEVRRRRSRPSEDALSVADTDVQTLVEDLPLQQEGVPLNVVVAIAFAVFFMTYIFF